MNRQTVLHSCLTLIASVLSLVTPINAYAQQTPDVGSVRLSRLGDLLLEHNIALTEPALLRALKNPDSEVRFLAAMKLAEDKAVKTVPAVKQALAVEKTPRARVNIAVALGLLGDPGGHEELKRACGDRNFLPEFRLYAVRYMFDLGVAKDEDCLHAAEEIVQIVDSENLTVGDRKTALELLPHFRNLTQQESQMVLDLVAHRLDDSEPVVQMAAGGVLVRLGNPAAIPHLEATIAREQDENTRSVLETNLKRLQQKGKQ